MRLDAIAGKRGGSDALPLVSQQCLVAHPAARRGHNSSAERLPVAGERAGAGVEAAPAAGRDRVDAGRC